MFVFAIVLLVLQSIGLLWCMASSIVDASNITKADILADLITAIIIKSPGIVFTILFICGVR